MLRIEIFIIIVLGFLCRLANGKSNITVVDNSYGEEEEEGREFWKEVVDKYNAEEASEHENAYKVVCYFPNFAVYRKPPATFGPKNVEPELCTHIHYLHVAIDPATLHLIPSDSFADFDKEFYQAITELKSNHPNLKVLVTLDGSRSKGEEYQKVLASEKEREHFIHNAIDFLKEYEFDGMDLMPPIDGVDKKDYALFMKEMRENFDYEKPRLLISGSVPAKRDVIEQLYDVDTLSKSCDYINVMTYDYHGSWEGVTGYQASIQDVEESMAAWVKLGVPPSKLILGVASYARSFTLSSGGFYDVGLRAVGPGLPGIETAEKGYLSYTEITENILRKQWKKASTQNGCYTFSGNQWASYDDPQQVLRKGQLVTKNSYGGMAIRDLSTDDFLGRACQCKFPILKAINYALGREINGFFENCP